MTPLSILSCSESPLVVLCSYTYCISCLYRIHLLSTQYDISSIPAQIFHWASRAFLGNTCCFCVAPISKADRSVHASDASENSISNLQAQLSQLFLAECVSPEFLASKFSLLVEPCHFVKAGQKEDNTALKSHHITCLLPGHICHRLLSNSVIVIPLSGLPVFHFVFGIVVDFCERDPVPVYDQKSSGQCQADHFLTAFPNFGPGFFLIALAQKPLLAIASSASFSHWSMGFLRRINRHSHHLCGSPQQILCFESRTSRF